MYIKHPYVYSLIGFNHTTQVYKDFFMSCYTPPRQNMWIEHSISQKLQGVATNPFGKWKYSIFTEQYCTLY